MTPERAKEMTILKATIDIEFADFLNEMETAAPAYAELIECKPIISLVYSAFVNAYLVAKEVQPAEVTSLFKRLDNEMYGGANAIQTH